MSQAGVISESGGSGGSYISLSPYIVGTDTHSGYATIALGIAAAVAGGATESTPLNVYVKPKANGTAYTENITLSPGINLIGFGGNPIINGTITFTATGNASVTGMVLQTNSANAIVLSGGNSPTLTVTDCYLNGTTANPVVSITDADAIFYGWDLKGDLVTGSSYFAVTHGAVFINSPWMLTGSSSTASTFSGDSSFSIYGGLFENPVAVSGSAAFSAFSANLGELGTFLTLTGTCLAYLFGCQVFAASSTAITIGAGCACACWNETNIDTTATDVITGAGTLNFSTMSFSNTGSTITVTTQNPQPVTVQLGGTGDSSFTPYSVICGGTTAAGDLQNVSGLGTSGQVLTSAGAAALPTWQTAGGSGDVSGPGSSTDRAIATWNGTGGTNLFDNSTTSISSTGAFTNSGQPCFLAYLTATQSNVTGNDAVYQIPFDTVIFDNGSNFTPGSSANFTAPVAGKYLFTAQVLVQPQTIVDPTILLGLVATSRSLQFRQDAVGVVSGTNVPYAISGIIDMAASDTCSVQLVIGGGGSNSSNVFGASGLYYTIFSGHLVC